MKLVIVSIALALCSVSANPMPEPTPQLFGYQAATPVGQWVSSNLQNSLQSVANAIQSITRPGQGPNVVGSQIVPQVIPPIIPNQIPNVPENYGQGHIQTVVQPVPVQTIVQPYPSGTYQPGFYQPGPYQPAPYQPGPYQPGPYQPGPYEQQIHVIPVPPPNTPWQNGGIPYRQNEDPKASTWAPLPPLYYQFGEPSIVIISRPPTKLTPPTESTTPDDLTNSTTMQPDAANTTTNSTETEQSSTPTPGKNDIAFPCCPLSLDLLFVFFKVPTTNYGTTSVFSPENGMNAPGLGLTMINGVPIAPTETTSRPTMPNTN